MLKFKFAFLVCVVYRWVCGASASENIAGNSFTNRSANTSLSTLNKTSAIDGHSLLGSAALRGEEPAEPADGFETAANGAGAVVAAVGVLQDGGSMSSVGELLTAASSLVPLLTFIPIPYGAIIGFALATTGGLLTTFAPATEPSTSDIMASMDAYFQVVIAKLDRVLELAKENNRLLNEIVDLIVTKKPEIEKINELFNAASSYYEALKQGENVVGNRMLLMGELEQASERSSYPSHPGALSASNLKDIIEAAIRKSLEAEDYTFCGAAKQVQWFMATRYQLYWMLMLHARLTSKSEDVAGAVMAARTKELKKNLLEYKSVVDSFASTQLWLAIQSTPSECRAKAWGSLCAQGHRSNGKCQCYGFWQNSRPAPAAASDAHHLLDGNLRVQCDYLPYSCPENVDVYITARKQNKHISVYQWLDWINYVQRVQIDEPQTFLGHTQGEKWRIHKGPEPGVVLLQNMFPGDQTWISPRAADEYPGVSFAHKSTLTFQKWGYWTFEGLPGAEARSAPISKSGYSIERNYDYGGGDCNRGDCIGPGGARWPRPLARAEECGRICTQIPACKSWTFVKTVIGSPNCALKRVFKPDRKLSTCCDSGLPAGRQPATVPKGRYLLIKGAIGKGNGMYMQIDKNGDYRPAKMFDFNKEIRGQKQWYWKKDQPQFHFEITRTNGRACTPQAAQTQQPPLPPGREIPVIDPPSMRRLAEAAPSSAVLV